MSKTERLADMVYWIIVLYGLFSAVMLVVSMTSFGRDDTDRPSPFSRSGLYLFTDYGTGCQYLSRSGALAPRTNKAGEHMGCVR